MQTENDTKLKLRENLKNLRQSLNLNGEQIAEILKINPATYRSWETGRAAPKYSILLEISKIYNVSVEELLSDIGEGKDILTNQVANKNTYNDDIYSDKYLNELSTNEKLLVMKARRLNLNDMKKLESFIDELMPE